MKSIIKITLSIIVALSFFFFFFCKNGETKITPVQASVPAPVHNTIIGKWRAVKGTTTIEREFISGINGNSGTGNNKETIVSTKNVQTVITSTFKWNLSGDILHFQIVADEFFFIQIINNGTRLLLFDEAHRNQLLFTFERVN